MVIIIQSKKAFAMGELGVIILSVVMAIVVLIVFLMVSGVLGPELSGAICGANIRVRQVAFSWAPFEIGKETVPLWLCKQHMSVVKIHASDFSQCAGLNLTICEHPEKFGDAKAIKSECQRQCARIQVDRLTNLCWTMVGNGKKTIVGPLKGGSIAGFAPDTVVGVRCFKFQIVDGRTADKNEFKYDDANCGWTSQYHVPAPGSPRLSESKFDVAEDIITQDRTYDIDNEDEVTSARRNCFSLFGADMPGECVWVAPEAKIRCLVNAENRRNCLAAANSVSCLLDYQYYKRDVCYIYYYDYFPVAGNDGHWYGLIGRSCRGWAEVSADPIHEN